VSHLRLPAQVASPAPDSPATFIAAPHNVPLHLLSPHSLPIHRSEIAAGMFSQEPPSKEGLVAHYSFQPDTLHVGGVKWGLLGCLVVPHASARSACALEYAPACLPASCWERPKRGRVG